MNYKYKDSCPKCNGVQRVVDFEEDLSPKTILMCLNCQNSQIIDKPYAEVIATEANLYFQARKIYRYGLSGTDTDSFLNVHIHREMIFVFGDNLIGQGKGGQAIIRSEVNAFGIPTKRLPSMGNDAFFSDQADEREAVLSKLRELYKLSKDTGKEIVFPLDGLGTGLAEMHLRSPKLFKEMNDIIFKFWNIEFDEPHIEMVQNSLFE